MAPPSSSQSSPNGKSAGDEEYYSSFLIKLLAVIGHADESSVTRVISAVRSGASHDQILQLVEEISQRTNRPNGSA
ncbi:uncharacterized protein N7469_003481 [Penicillium citrinum]|uniref:Uncharacterized protein n=2 Tax=Penicillium TaxID=5073 RepID=A0A9W9P5D2_PENCI|nr:uncharacterized protein N7469_003481 [Penicillium citrinum]KAJ5234313.1 hypothetical protein N7469_003481 [Penicillium citrinum]KAJ5589923.1 hypothetical protein N7450_003895 [Penicillium hetheringtonii]